MSRFGSPTLTAVFAACAALISAPALAVTFGYQMSINDPIFNSTNGNANVPDFQLENISDLGSGIGITDFSLTIGNTGFNYDFVRIQSVFTDPMGDLKATLNTVGTVNDGVGDDLLDYDFTGFDAGDAFRFEVDVDPDSGSPTQDFRQVLFPTALLSVTFSNGSTLSQNLAPANTGVTGYRFAQTETIPAPVPLPGSLALYLSAGLVGGGLMLRRRKMRA
ncbi:hypothetical protein [Actibacterium sp. 188UL27-1]|uniref:hypothetical protein n=1 Tax=Actibacterium sp. 188UL27-1 TaxID=2786961 RepID=UPI0019580618|nr:hypothetical protein [Actibacterium sp. 188UL27-1]MBM7068746.1 hypothetical protein [Actibacterium sp. 188UL27-1]